MAPVEAAAAEATTEHAHDAHAHDEHHDEEHARENAAHADDAPHIEHAGEGYAVASSDELARAPEGDDDHDDEDDGEDAEEEVVESVGGDDVLEEVPERAFRPRRQYKIQEVIKRRQVMLVQVVKEERGNKGAALTTYLSLAGRYAVLMPNTARGGGISRKITSAQDRSRLKEVVQDLDVPEGMGIILRTAGASRTKPEIKRDFEYLIRMWETVRDMTLKSQAPTLVYEEGSLIKRSLRDLYNKEIDEIQVAGEAGYQEARDFMKMLMPSNVRAVKQYRDGQPLFSRMGVESQLDAMFSPTVQLRSGGYIVINQTEALVSIDVNSGRSTREHHIEDTALKTNLEAAEEVARQLRLRDLAGLIVIDFIDMDEKRNNRAVERKLSDCLRQDRARIQVGRISHFGLLEMSRQRIRASVLESSTEPCPHMRRQRPCPLGLVGGAAVAARHRGNPDEGRDPQSGGAHPHRRRALRAQPQARPSARSRKRLQGDARRQSPIRPSAGQQSFIIDRGEQVHTLEAAKALLAAQAAAFPPQVEEAYDDDEAFDIETESEVETEETEGLADDAAEAAAGEGEADGHRRKRRRRRRGRGEPRDGAAPREDGDADARRGRGRRRRDRREQVHTLEAAKALLAAQVAAFPTQTEEAFDEDEPIDIEVESEVETEETEELTDDVPAGEEGKQRSRSGWPQAQAAAAAARPSRRGARRRAAAREHDAARVAFEAVAISGVIAEESETDEDESDEHPVWLAPIRRQAASGGPGVADVAADAAGAAGWTVWPDRLSTNSGRHLPRKQPARWLISTAIRPANRAGDSAQPTAPAPEPACEDRGRRSRLVRYRGGDRSRGRKSRTPPFDGAREGEFPGRRPA